MTLRGSEQSLLHSLVRPDRRRDGASRRTRAWRLNSILLSATTAILMVIGGILQLATFDQELAQINLAAAPGKYVHVTDSWNHEQRQNSYRQTGDVIIPDAYTGTEQSYSSQHLRHLTRERGHDLFSDYEISKELVLRALSQTEKDNFVISRGLKFYRTENEHLILACSDQISPFTDQGTVDLKSNQYCYSIDVTPQTTTIFPTGKIL